MASLTPPGDTEYDQASAVKFLALHLICTRDFYRLMVEKPSSLFDITLKPGWLCKVALVGREKKFLNDKKWLDEYRREKYESRVLHAALDIFNDLPSYCKVRTDANIPLAPPASFTPEWNKVREDLFCYQEIRRQLLDVSKRCEQQRYAIIKSHGVEFLEQNHTDPQQQQVLKKLFLIQETQEESRNALSYTRLERAVVEGIDHLLTECHSDPKAASEGQSHLELYAQAINGIMERYAFKPQDIRQLEFSHPFAESDFASKRTISEMISQPNPSQIGHTQISSRGSLTDHDSDLVNQVSQVFGEIDHTRFKSNFSQVLNSKTRAPYLSVETAFSKDKNAKRRYKATRGKRARNEGVDKLLPSEVLHDNLCHTHALFEICKRELPAGTAMKSIDQTWLRLIAIIACCYGCTSEPAFFLTTMDRLLEVLRLDFGCSTGMYASTISGSPSNLVQQISQPSRQSAFTIIYQPPTDASTLAQNNKRRQLVSELSLFIRGCIINATISTSCTFKTPTRPQRTVFESLLSWKDICSICGEKMILPEGDLPRRVISVGIRDARVGNNDIRRQISTNRPDVYQCFSVFTSEGGYQYIIGWCHSLGPFFFYFATLQHPKCKNYRDIETAVE